MATVLALGLDPTFADFTSMPGLTSELVQAFIDSQLERVRALGYQVESCLVDSGFLIGDSPEDVRAARCLGARGCLVRTGWATNPLSSKKPPQMPASSSTRSPKQRIGSCISNKRRGLELREHSDLGGRRRAPRMPKPGRIGACKSFASSR